MKNSKSNTPKRTYIIGGKYGKVKGFDFYIQKNDKLKPFQRKRLLNESESLISQLIDKETRVHNSLDRVNKILTYLDNTHNDQELVETWNNIYDEYGCRMSPFKDKWENEVLSQFNKELINEELLPQQ